MCLIENYSKHPSILMTRKCFKYPSDLSLVPVVKYIIAKDIKKLDPKKPVPRDEIPVKLNYNIVK